MSSPELSLSPTPELPDADDPPAAPAADLVADGDDDLSEAESVLSDVDEAQFEDFDPNQITIEERPAIAVDEDNVRLLGRHRRRRQEEEKGGEKRKA